MTEPKIKKAGQVILIFGSKTNSIPMGVKILKRLLGKRERGAGAHLPGGERCSASAWASWGSRRIRSLLLKHNRSAVMLQRMWRLIIPNSKTIQVYKSRRARFRSDGRQLCYRVALERGAGKRVMEVPFEKGVPTRGAPPWRRGMQSLGPGLSMVAAMIVGLTRHERSNLNRYAPGGVKWDPMARSKGMPYRHRRGSSFRRASAAYVA